MSAANDNEYMIHDDLDGYVLVSSDNNNSDFLDSADAVDGALAVIDDQDKYKVTNIIDQSLYKSTIFEEHLKAIILSKVKEAVIDEAGSPVLKIRAAEIRNIMQKKGGSFYKRLDNAAKHMTGMLIGLNIPPKDKEDEDRGGGKFHYMALITEIGYENGVLSVYLNSNARKFLIDPKKNFNWHSRSLDVKFQNVYAVKLYHYITSKCIGYIKKKQYKYKVHISVAELKFMLGVADINDRHVKSVLEGEATPDFTKAIDAIQSDGVMYEKWSNFNFCVLKPAVEEINQISPMEVRVKPIRSGKGGEIVSLDFYIKNKENASIEDEPMTEDEIDAFLDDMDDIIVEKLKTSDKKAIAKAAGYDIDKVKQAYGALRAASDVKNIVGFMIKAIQDGYAVTPKEKIIDMEESAEKKTKTKRRSSKKNAFNDFEQNSYDFDEIEKILNS